MGGGLPKAPKCTFKLSCKGEIVRILSGPLLLLYPVATPGLLEGARCGLSPLLGSLAFPGQLLIACFAEKLLNFHGAMASSQLETVKRDTGEKREYRDGTERVSIARARVSKERSQTRHNTSPAPHR